MSLAASLLLLAASAPSYVDWWLVGTGGERTEAVFIDKSTINRRADGWTTFSEMEVVNGEHQIRGRYKSTRSVGWAQCATRSYMQQSGSVYGDDGQWKGDFNDYAPRHVVQPGSVEDKVLLFACGDESHADQYPRGSNPIAIADAIYANSQKAARNNPAHGTPRQ